MYINRTDPQFIRESTKPASGRRNHKGEFTESIASVAEIDVIHINDEQKREQPKKQPKREHTETDKPSATTPGSLDVKV